LQTLSFTGSIANGKNPFQSTPCPDPLEASMHKCSIENDNLVGM